jgi:hypothetical protein
LLSYFRREPRGGPTSVRRGKPRRVSRKLNGIGRDIYWQAPLEPRYLEALESKLPTELHELPEYPLETSFL